MRRCASRVVPPTAAAAASAQCRHASNSNIKGSGSGAMPSSSSSSSLSTTAKPRGIRLDQEEGLSGELGGFGHYSGSIAAFMKPESEKKEKPGLGPGGGGGPLPCDVGGSPAALQAAQAELMANAAMTGKLPSPRRPAGSSPFAAAAAASASASVASGGGGGGGGMTAPTAAQMEAVLGGRAPLPSLPRPPQQQQGCGHDHSGDHHGHSHGKTAAAAAPSSLPKRPIAAAAASAANARPIARGTAAAKLESPFAKPPPSFQEKQRLAQAAAGGTNKSSATGAPSDDPTAPPPTPEELAARAADAESYYRDVPRNTMSKEEMWQRITTANAERIAAEGTALSADDVDYIQMEEDLKEHDLLHYRVGEIAYPDQRLRRDYYAMWQLAMALNKARWTMLEVQSQRGVKSTGAGMKLLFWKESVNSIMDKRAMTQGQFADSHPILRPFAAAVEHNPHMTKAFVRGFTGARLKVIQQPGNVQQLFDHFDKYYGYFFNSLLEVTGVKDENAEHMMQHIGRATGLTNHCVMFWKKYARIGFTMLPADLCADNHVNLALLKNITLASKDRAVRKVLYDVMCIAKDEMLHAQQLAPSVDPKAWPIAMECLYANYYLGFLQRREFNVSAMFADYNIDNAGFTWYRVKKRWEWERHQSLPMLLDEAAPIPLIGTSVSHRGSKYKMATGMGQKKGEATGGGGGGGGR